jgi:hypothetical protein
MVTLHLTRTFCLPILLYGLESLTVTKSYLNSIQFCWDRVLFRIFKISSRDNVNYVLYCTGILPLPYQIDLKKLRFYRVHCLRASDNMAVNIVWHVLISTSRRTVDTLLTEYDVLRSGSDASYVRAVWTKFSLELQ